MIKVRQITTLALILSGLAALECFAQAHFSHAGKAIGTSSPVDQIDLSLIYSDDELGYVDFDPNNFGESNFPRAPRTVARPYYPFASFVLPQISAKVGEEFDLELGLDVSSVNTENLDSYYIVGYRASVRFNASVIAVKEYEHRGLISDGMHTVELTGTLDAIEFDNSSIVPLASLPVQAALGNANETVLELVDFVWITAHGRTIPCEAQVQHGLLRIDDSHKLDRNVDETAYASVAISPNPLTVASTITVNNLDGHSGNLRIYTLRGQLVRQYELNSNANEDSFDVEIVRRDLTSGPYFCRLTIGDRAIVQMLIVE